MTRKADYAVIPAAGRGTRLGLNIPKLLAPVSEDATIWSVLREKLFSAAERIHLVVAPRWKSTFESLLAGDPQRKNLSFSVQQEPRGMGDAIFESYQHWAAAETAFVVWGDQIHISRSTLQSALSHHEQSAGQRCTIPTVILDKPYVQYCFDEQDRLTAIRETREGAVCDPRGFSDVGTFLLDVGTLHDTWNVYRREQNAGAVTGEINFLPFLPYLAKHGWEVSRIAVEDPIEARGINSLEDLKFFQELYERNRKLQPSLADSHF
jgi:bifunctional UDP-N-acetylglucosamine pyrophosphorylase/glucosamine-1-phosphate N-acetyltransferase